MAYGPDMHIMDISHFRYFGYCFCQVFRVKPAGAQVVEYPEGLFYDAAPPDDDHAAD